MVTGPEKKLFGLIGRGIGHSFSADYFNGKFEAGGINAEYRLFDLPRISLLPELISRFPGLQGLNVTSPYKREVIPFLDYLSPEAATLNAVNVIEFCRKEGDLSLRGHNTDATGFLKTLEGLFPKTGCEISALVFGTGGASSAVGYALRQMGIPYLTVSRTPGGNHIGYEEANGLLSSHRLIINATPAGMYPDIDSSPPIDFSRVSDGHIFYDLIYNPAETLFLRKAREKGALAVNGMQMLLNQAEGAWQIWTEKR